MTALTLKTGLAALRRKDYKSIHSQSIAAIQSNIRDPLPYFLLGVLASDHGNHRKALELFTKSTELGPDEPTFAVYRAKELSTLGLQNEAKIAANTAAQSGVKDAFLLDTLGVIYSRSGDHMAAIPLFKRAVSGQPDQANFHYNLAASAQFLGDFDTARTAYRTTLELDPAFYRAWPPLVSLRKQTLSDNHLEALTALFEEARGDADAQLQIGHAIAKTLEDLDRHAESLDWLLRGKSAKREQLRYDRLEGERLFKAAKTAPPMQALHDKMAIQKSMSEPLPIFIVGLPRSGTTLVDRILSSHTHVTSAGELNIFAELIKKRADTPSNLVMDADTLIRANTLDLSEVGANYQAFLQDRFQALEPSETPAIIDKMPLNFFYAGLIHKALPRARIIALRRGAMDSCLSNFRQLFSTQYSYYNYSFDLGDTAWFYRQFDALMSHWAETLPPERFMEVRYEDIVFDQDRQTRRLLDFCDLDWQEACLRFHENSAPVSTASSVQVRQPLYSGSIGRWQKYGGGLAGLRRALGELAEQ